MGRQWLASLRAQHQSQNSAAVLDEQGPPNNPITPDDPSCITNGPPFMTNIVVTFVDTNTGWNVSFDVLGGENQVMDVFYCTNLVGNNITNSQWYWITNAYICYTVYLTNQFSNQAFYVIGTQ